jgi:hypothetical protein
VKEQREYQAKEERSAAEIRDTNKKEARAVSAAKETKQNQVQR